MLRPTYIVGIFLVSIAILAAGVVSGQNYPNKPIRVLTSEIGAGSDFVARLIAQGLSASLGQQVIVENRPSGVIPIVAAAKATPDGYTMLFYSSPFWLGPLLQKTPYDPVKDFLPISLTNMAPNVLVVHPSLSVKSVQDLIALAKARPGQLNYGSGSTGSTPHLAAELFKAMAGVNIVRVSYRGSGPALSDLIGGQVQLMFGTSGAAVQHVKSGRLRALAVTSAQPSALLPGLPTVAASGLPGYESTTGYAMLAPGKTPVAIINRLNQEIVRVLNQPDVKQKLFDSGVETVGSSPEELVAAIKSEMGRMGKVIKDAGIRNE